MEQKNIDILNTFTVDTMPDLDVAVLGALELFAKSPPRKLQLNMCKRPLVVGSGNAEATGRIIFSDSDALFASESDYEHKLKHIENIDGVVIVSASGGKHAPSIARTSKTYGKHVTLITSTKNSSTHKELDHAHDYDEFVYAKNREPYTYNTSTYMGMILGHTGENPSDIYRFVVDELAGSAMPDFSTYNKFFFIVPPHLGGIVRMLQVKFMELFGRNIARDIETAEYMPHATTLVPSNELFVSFGDAHNTWGEENKRLNIPLPKNAGYATMMSVGYYIIGQIQKQHHPYFKENVVAYTKKASDLFGHTISPIVD